ncbi:carboxypeptidase-like regulatory domain-containing protein [Tenacibaculum sp. AHE15PA]|uniref:TonB-dependent receptor n=1 Tax=unclassified Tenacibaculum TaxID=2635139 RepID=UPI001C4EEA94|nr:MULTISPECIES: TonB-dependent receptor [unclassified Tenacibaculum]QXP72990.1 carboxypeptidase-like regulatory domain-containing protein [Tenacibaculum sp. AHE14PA]QXP76904.1 carboxypeptidase-like regulatory domain-containing protein [Tenacibaculum sp. AHE15PA]
MLKRIIFPLLVFIAGSFCNAQTVIFKGTVKDSLQNPLSYANIIAKPKDVTKNMSFAITDEQGRYRLELTKNNTYTISISYLGYEKVDFEITPTENSTKNFVLKEAKNQLDEVVIELPVTVKQDTIIYNTDKFVNGSERKLKNVLKKLPGVEVDKNGGVTVQGKKVTKLLVDGKKFFGGGTKLGVENIPADAVDKVEVIDNYNEVAFLKNVSDSDEMAMNIKLKEDKKRFLFGDVEAGSNVGYDSFYKTNANLFYYSPKTNVNFISNLNNIGEKTFTFKDYMNFQGGVNAVFNGNFNWRGGDFSQFLENKDVLQSVQRFGALNITKTVASKLDISGYAIFSHNNTQSFNEATNQYTTFLEEKESKTTSKNILAIGKFNIEYAPNNKEQWYVRTQVKKSAVERDNLTTTAINTQLDNINTNKDNDIWYVNQNIEWHKDQSEKHTFSATANYTFDKNNPTTFWNASQSFLDRIKPIIQPLNTNQASLRINQLNENEKHHLYTVFKDFWVINNDNHIYTTIGNTHQQEKFISNDFQLLDDATENDFSSNGFNNTTVLKHNDFFAGVHYKFRTGIFTFKQGAYAHNYNWRVNQSTSIKKDKWVVLPDFLVKIEFNKSKKIQLNYNLKTNFSNASKLASRFYLQSYNSVFKGNPNLENELYHSARIRYSRFSLYRGLMLFANANYTKKVKGFRSAVNFDGVNRFLTIDMLDNPNESWGVRSSLRKKIKNIRYNIEGNYKASNFKQSINNSFVTNKSNDYGFDVGIETLFDKFPTIEAGFRRSIGKYTSSNSTSKFTTNEPYVNIDYDFLDGFVFNFDYTHYNYQNKAQNIDTEYNVANAVLSYQKEDSPWMFKLTTQNLFDTTFKQSNSFSDYLIADTKTYVMPRVLLFSIGYKL